MGTGGGRFLVADAVPVVSGWRRMVCAAAGVVKPGHGLVAWYGLFTPRAWTRFECLRMEGRGTHVSSGTVHINIGERLAMRGTATGREARLKHPYGDSRAGPGREHVRREPFSDD